MKWLFSILMWAAALALVGVSVWLVWTRNEEILLLVGSFASILSAALILTVIGVANAPRKGELT